MKSNEEKEIFYDVSFLKQQFGQLKEAEDFVLTPLLDCFFYKWVYSLPDKVISDIRRKREQRGEEFYCVVDRKIVKIEVYGRDIDVEDADESWYMANSIHFKGREEQANKTFSRFKRFVERNNLEEFVSFSCEELQKGKVHHLSGKMIDFYFRGKEK